MTAHRSITITCDYGGKGEFVCSTPEYFAGPRDTTADARAYLRDIGWVYRGGLDLCPEHASARLRETLTQP